MNSAKNAELRSRRQKCGLPPRVSFPRIPQGESSVADDEGQSDGINPALAGDGDDGERRTSRFGRNQMQEDILMENACQQVQWLMSRLAVTLKYGDGGEDTSKDATIVEIFGKRVAISISCATDSSSLPAERWTIFDLQQIASKCEKLIDKSTQSLLLSSLDKEDYSIDNGSSDHGKEIGQCWSRMLKEHTSMITAIDSNRSCPWEQLLLLPYRTAASRIISMYNNLYTTSNNNVSSSSDNEAIENYLNYHAAQTLEHMEHVTLPSLQKQLVQQEKYHQQRQHQHKIIETMNNTAFEKWDDYCMNILGVESDSLPLFPELNDTGSDALDTIIDEYAADVGKCVVNSMISEFEQLAERFLQSLANVDAQDTGLSNAAGVKCYGRDISKGIIYCRHFTNFLSAASGGSVNDQKGKDLSTLHHFVSSAQVEGDDGEQSTPAQSSPLLSQFTSSPITRANLLSDLHQLETFLSSRKIELSSRSSSARSGRDIVDDISLQWTQYCLQEASSSSSLQSTLALAEISLDDVTIYLDAVHNVSMQIAGEGLQAKRLRFLADAVGLSNNTDVHDSLMFQSACRKAAFLAHKMTICQDQQEASSKMLETCARAIKSTREIIADVECRVRMIRGKLNDL